MLQGLDLTNTLVGVLTRFREEPVAFMTDVEAMFYQVRVQPEDCKYLRFLWRPHGDLGKEPEEHQMLAHLFAGASSPSCVNYALKRTAEDNKEDFDAITIATVKRNFYVDDCLKSVPTNPKAIKLVGELRELLSRLGFRLTKWISNSKKVIDSVPESEKAPSVKTKTATRRRILSVICSVYDPLGFVSPCILPAKAIQQDLCLKGLGWDDPIPETSKLKWEAWLRELPKLEQFQIPRCFNPQEFSDVKRCELHH